LIPGLDIVLKRIYRPSLVVSIPFPENGTIDDLLSEGLPLSPFANAELPCILVTDWRCDPIAKN
jgi:hypothetical protein